MNDDRAAVAALLDWDPATGPPDPAVLPWTRYIMGPGRPNLYPDGRIDHGG